MTFNANNSGLPKQEEGYFFEVVGCYKYQTVAKTEVCLNPVDTKGAKIGSEVCKLKDISMGIQGAPIAIKKIKKYILPVNEEPSEDGIRKNKVYFIKNNVIAKKYVFNAENYKLIKLVQKYPFLEPLLEEIQRKCSSSLIILFGSFAKFVAKEGSDIDIFIKTSNQDTKKEIESINSKLSIKIGRFDKNSLLIKEIIKNHVIVRGLEEYYEKIGFFE